MFKLEIAAFCFFYCQLVYFLILTGIFFDLHTTICNLFWSLVSYCKKTDYTPANKVAIDEGFTIENVNVELTIV